MKIRNKNTGQIFEVLEGTRYPDFFEEVKETKKAEKPAPEVKEAETPEVKEEITEEAPKEAEKPVKKGKKNGANK